LFHPAKSKKSGHQAGFLLSSDNQKTSIVVMMFLLNDHDLGIVIAPAIDRASTHDEGRDRDGRLS
jgi:hypothetical protein